MNSNLLYIYIYLDKDYINPNIEMCVCIEKDNPARESERDCFVKSWWVLPRPLTSLWYRKVLTKARREPAHIILLTCRLRPAALCPGLQPSAPQIALKHTQQVLLPPLWVKESPEGQRLLQDFIPPMFSLLLLAYADRGHQATGPIISSFSQIYVPRIYSKSSGQRGRLQEESEQENK